MTMPTDRELVLDGGLATLLERTGHDLTGELWSAAVLRTDPAAVEAAHLAFFAAGADVATTATYQLTPLSLHRAGFDASDFPALVQVALGAARSARDRAGRGWVAGSVGPYGASLANGAEYTGDYALGHGETAVRALREHHRPRLVALLAAGVDALACETIPSLVEIEALVRELDALDADIPVWFSVTPRPGGTRTRTGEPLAEVAAAAQGLHAAYAVGANCCPPADIAPALESLRESGAALAGVAYPNSGEEWDATTRRWRGAPAWTGSMTDRWRADGARLIGGCCRVFPEHIHALADEMRRSRAAEPGSGAT